MATATEFADWGTLINDRAKAIFDNKISQVIATEATKTDGATGATFAEGKPAAAAVKVGGIAPLYLIGGAVVLGALAYFLIRK